MLRSLLSNIYSLKICSSVIPSRYFSLSPARWKSVRVELDALMEEYADVVNLAYIDFPENWKEVL